MTDDLKLAAIKAYNKASQRVANGGDLSLFLLMDKITAAGGMDALGIDPKQLDDLNRRGAVNGATSILQYLERVDSSSPSFEVCGRLLTQAMNRLGTNGYLQLGVQARERLSVYAKKLSPHTPSICGDE